jgi:cytochrome c556
MKKNLGRVAALAILAGLAVVFTSDVGADEKKAKTIKEVMGVQKSSTGAITKAAKDAKWDDAAKTCKAWLEAAGDLSKNKPPKGDEESWKKHTTKYVETVSAVGAAIEKKDAEGVTKALKLDCGGCHGAHKGK